VIVDPQQKSSQMERLVVLGADGVVGANLAVCLANRFRVLAISLAQPIALEGCQTAHCSAEEGSLASLIRQVEPQWILHCGPLACSSWDLPSSFAAGDEVRHCRMLAKLAGQVGARLTVVSTDAIFAGPRMFHGEAASANRLHPFAQAALRVEQALAPTSALIVRTHAYGWCPIGVEPTFAQKAWQSIAEGVPQRFSLDRHATPILVTDLAELLHRAYLRKLQGVSHVAGAERTSQHRFAVELAAAFGLSGPVLAEEPEESHEKRRSDRLDETSLSTQRARRALETSMPLLREGLERFARQARDGYRARLQPRSHSAAA